MRGLMNNDEARICLLLVTALVSWLQVGDTYELTGKLWNEAVSLLAIAEAIHDVPIMTVYGFLGDGIAFVRREGLLEAALHTGQFMFLDRMRGILFLAIGLVAITCTFWLEHVLALLYYYKFKQDLTWYSFHRNCFALLILVSPFFLWRRDLPRTQGSMAEMFTTKRVEVPRREPQSEDVCPICHDLLLCEEASSEEPVGKEPVGEETVAPELACEEPAGEETVGEDPAGNEPASEETLGEDAARKEPACEECLGEDPGGEDVAGNAVRGEAIGEDALGVDAVGGDAAGGDAVGEDVGVDAVDDAVVGGDTVGGDAVRGGAAVEDAAAGDAVGAEPTKKEYASLSFCKFGCGRGVHTECMKNWLNHRAVCVYCESNWSCSLPDHI
eukprot:TRINITY_DN30875_c0_g1_i1.p1 TRINITY_DN30875_c0_g1~~TRINITY_DN30875_c0_g1_i1.p1  ORF type:complete len:438 (+),score=55.14 TRINITY_DN30875_c0_g1_i1:162-1316(+)